jgi:hypothetical protein
MVTRLDRHYDANVIPPVQARADGQHDSVLGRRLLGSWWDEESRPPDPVRIQFLNDHPVENGAKLTAHVV